MPFEDPRRFGDPVPLQLPFRPPLFPNNLFGHLAATAVPGVEEWRNGAFRRTLRLSGGPAIIELQPPPSGAAAVSGRLWTADHDDADEAVGLCRRLLDLDAEPELIDGTLSRDPVLAPLVARTPGRRVPGSVDAAEMAVRAVLGQQVSTAAARTHAARLVMAHGEPVVDPAGELRALFPTPTALLRVDADRLALPGTRKRTLIGLIRSLVEGRVRLGGDLATARDQLSALPGFGPWTVETVLMRAFGDADAFLPGDLGVRLAAERLGLPTKPAALLARSRLWSPWRAYAVQHLWATGDHAVNRLPM